MRKIEKQMNEAILNRKDFFKGNTSVQHYTTETGAREAVVHLHGNHIATIGDTLQICDAGWQTVTTKSRLNALLNEFAEGCYLFQKKLRLVPRRCWRKRSTIPNRKVCDSLNTVTQAHCFSGSGPL